MDTSIDPTIKNLVSAIGRAETGGSTDPYNQKGPSGENGRYQFMPDTWKLWSKEQLGDENAPMSVENQNKVAYNKVKQWKEQGLTPAQIASKWNSGDENAYKTQTPGKNSMGVYYDTPGYTAKVSNYYKELSGSSTTTTDTPETKVNTPTTVPKSPDLLDKLGGFVNSIFPGAQIGKAAGNSIEALYEAITTGSWDPIERASQENDANFGKIVADVGSTVLSALPVGGPEGAGVLNTLGRIGTVGAAGAGVSGLSDIAGGETDPSKILKSAGVGGVIGLATGGLFEGAGAALRKIVGKSAEEIAQVAEKDVSKLSTREQQEWYRQKATETRGTSEALSKQAKDLGEQAVIQAKKEIQDFNEKIGTTSRDTAINLKEPAKQIMRDASSEYIALTGEAVDNAGSKLTKTITHEDLASKIDSKFEYNPEVGASLKNDLGLKEGEQLIPGAKNITETPKITNQEILDKAREIMQTVSKTARTGGKTYSPAEYEAMQKYSFLMQTLGENGVDMKAANDFWKSWTPVRDKIVSQIKPFDEGAIKGTPMARTIINSEAPAVTAKQVVSKLEAQNLIKELETRMKLPEGTIGSDVKEAIAGLEKAKVSKENIEKIVKETTDKIKADKVEALKTMSLSKYNSEKIARTRKIITAIISTALGLGILGKGVIGAAAHVIP